ncbi:MAG TPA: hypothetical protein VHQ90_19170 [Thermoanaerobaculia bacterium]|nr:hypothetical protein [Thermoanaerobaculia bacterium]
MPEKESEQKESKELTVDDLEAVAGGAEPEGVEIGETDGGSKDVKIS